MNIEKDGLLIVGDYTSILPDILKNNQTTRIESSTGKKQSKKIIHSIYSEIGERLHILNDAKTDNWQDTNLENKLYVISDLRDIIEDLRVQDILSYVISKGSKLGIHIVVLAKSWSEVPKDITKASKTKLLLTDNYKDIQKILGEEYTYLGPLRPGQAILQTLYEEPTIINLQEDTMIRLGNPEFELPAVNTLVIGPPGSGKTEMINGIKHQLESRNVRVVDDLYGPGRLNLVSNMIGGQRYIVAAQRLSDVPQEVQDMFDNIILISKDHKEIEQVIGNTSLVPTKPFEALIKLKDKEVFISKI